MNKYISDRSRNMKNIHVCMSRTLRLVAIVFFLTFFTAAFHFQPFLLHVRADNPSSNGETTQQAAEATQEQDAITGYDVVYVIDNSKSVWSQSEERNEAFRTITEQAAGSDVRVGVVYFADHVYKELPLTSLETEEGSAEVMDFLNMTDTDNSNIDTNIGTALESAVALFDGGDSSREQLVVLFSDGINENASGDESYKEAADTKTEEQMKILQDDNIPVYCVYLQKDRNDETYLKQLVNYFSDDNNYAQDRFAKVTSEHIDTLSDTFSKVFVVMQNEVEERKEESSAAETETTQMQTETEGQTEQESAAESTENVTETQAAAPASDSGSGVSPVLLILLVVLAVAAAAALFFVMKGMKKVKTKVSDTDTSKADRDFGAVRMQYEWTYADFDNAMDKWKMYQPEVKKLVKKGRISADDADADEQKFTELAEQAESVTEAAQNALDQADSVLNDNGNQKANSDSMKKINQELSGKTEELKQIAAEMSEILRRIEDNFLK